MNFYLHFQYPLKHNWVECKKINFKVLTPKPSSPLTSYEYLSFSGCLTPGANPDFSLKFSVSFAESLSAQDKALYSSTIKMNPKTGIMQLNLDRLAGRTILVDVHAEGIQSGPCSRISISSEIQINTKPSVVGAVPSELKAYKNTQFYYELKDVFYDPE